MDGTIQTLSTQKGKARSVLILVWISSQNVYLGVPVDAIAGHVIVSTESIDVIRRVLLLQKRLVGHPQLFSISVGLLLMNPRNLSIYRLGR